MLMEAVVELVAPNDALNLECKYNHLQAGVSLRNALNHATPKGMAHRPLSGKVRTCCGRGTLR